MNLNNLAKDVAKDVSVLNILKCTGTATRLRINKDKMLAKHSSRTQAVLILLSGQASYQEETRTINLSSQHEC